MPNALPPSLAQLVEAHGGIGTRELDAIARGDAAVVTLHSSDKDEVALLGIVAAPVPRSFYVAHAWEIASSLERPSRSVGIVRDPASPSDFDGISFSDADAKSVRKCRPLHCGFKLPAGDMSRIAAAVGASADQRGALDSAMRRWLADRVDDYRTRGDSALPIYDDTRLNEQSSEGFARLLSESSLFLRDYPGLTDYLQGSPSRSQGGVESVIYWTVDHPEGLSPIVGVVQHATTTPADGRTPTLLITKQIYANHYFDARLDIVAVADGPTEAEPETYALVVRRVRFDKLPSGGMFDLRGRVVRKLRAALHAELTETRTRLQTLYHH